MATGDTQRGTSDKTDLPEKMCVICGIDVAQIARVKDETGRYMCRPCAVKQAKLSEKMAVQQTKATNAARAGTRPAIDDPDAGVDLAGAVSAERSAETRELPPELACPKCSGYMEAEQKLCLRCGYDRVRKAAVATKVEKARDVKDPTERRRRAGLDVETWLAIMGLVLGVASIIGAAQAFFDPKLAFAGAVVAGISGLACTISIIVVQFRSGEKVWGIVTILSGFVPFLQLGVLYWVIAECDRYWLKYWYATSFIAIVLVVFAAFSGKLKEFDQLGSSSADVQAVVLNALAALT